MSFQTFVNTQPAPAVAGDFASSNPRASVLAGPGGLIAGPSGVVIGRFAWANASVIDGDGAPAVVANTGAGLPTGLVHREQQGLITIYLAESSMVIAAGFQMSLMASVDLWAKNEGATEALYGQKVYAAYANGAASAAAAGAPGTASGSASSIAASTSSVTGSIAGNIMTVTAVGSGAVVPGETYTGTNVATGTKVVAQILPLIGAETLGGVGRYAVNIGEQTVASTALSGTYGTMTVGGTVAGAFGVGDTLTGASVVTGTTITALGTGTGGAGTYIVDNNTVVSSTAITAGTTIETKYYVRSSALPGELMKISPIAP